MAYSAISQAETDPDSPLTDTLFTKMRDNWIAIKNAENGAPKISPEAFAKHTGGSYPIFLATSTGSTANAWVVMGGANTGFYFTYVWRAHRSGNYLFWLSANNRLSTSTASNFQVWRNNLAYSQVYTCPIGQSTANFIFELYFNQGDVFDVRLQSQSAGDFGCLVGINNGFFHLVS